MTAAKLRARETDGMVTGIFRDRESAERAYRTACDRGYQAEEISLAMSDHTRRRWYLSKNATGLEPGTQAPEGEDTGGAVDDTLGGLATVGTNLVLPGLGLIVAGPLAANLTGTGAGAGGLTGGLLGTLVGWGIPEDRAKTYEAGLHQGGTVIGIRPHSEEDADYLMTQWRNQSGEHVYR